MTTSRFSRRPGVLATIASDYTGYGDELENREKVSQFGLKKGDTVTLLEYNSFYRGWLVRGISAKTDNTVEVWIKSEKLVKPGSTARPKPKEQKATRNPFKVGDLVRLVTTRSSIYSNSKKFLTLSGLTVGGVYTVRETDLTNCPGPEHEGSYIMISGYGMYLHAYDCFELVKEKKKAEAPVVKDRLPEFLTELEALIKKYK